MIELSSGACTIHMYIEYDVIMVRPDLEVFLVQPQCRACILDRVVRLTLHKHSHQVEYVVNEQSQQSGSLDGESHDADQPFYKTL